MFELGSVLLRIFWPRQVWSDTHKLSIKLDGFSDKLPLLLERICAEVANHRVQQDRFEPVRPAAPATLWERGCGIA